MLGVEEIQVAAGEEVVFEFFFNVRSKERAIAFYVSEVGLFKEAVSTRKQLNLPTSLTVMVPVGEGWMCLTTRQRCPPRRLESCRHMHHSGIVT